MRVVSKAFTPFVQLCLAFVLLGITAAQAETYTYEWNAPSPCPGGCDDGWATVESVKATYEKTEESETFEFDIFMSRGTANVVPNALALIANNSASVSPATENGTNAMVYLDVSSGDLIITVYGSAKGVWTTALDGDADTAGAQQPDTIASSLVDNSFVIDSLVEETQDTNGYALTRRFYVKLDVSGINSHTPLYNTAENWNGIRIGDDLNEPDVATILLNLFHDFTPTYQEDVPAEEPAPALSRIAAPTYNIPVGYLKDYWICGVGLWLAYNQATPRCAGAGEVTIEPNSTQTLTFMGFDNDQLTVNYSGDIKPWMSFSPVDGSTGTSPFNIEVSASPTDADAGTYVINVRFEDPFAKSASCPLKIKVPAVPVCDLGNITECVSCNEVDITKSQGQLDGVGVQFKGLGRKVAGQLLKLNKSKFSSLAKKTKSELNTLYLDLWTAAFEFPGVVNQCETSNLCFEVTLTTNKDTYTSSLERATSLIKRATRKGMKEAKRIRNKSALKKLTKLRDKAEEESNFGKSILATIPETQSVCGSSS